MGIASKDVPTRRKHGTQRLARNSRPGTVLHLHLRLQRACRDGGGAGDVRTGLARARDLLSSSRRQLGLDPARWRIDDGLHHGLFHLRHSDQGTLLDPAQHRVRGGAMVRKLRSVRRRVLRLPGRRLARAGPERGDGPRRGPAAEG